MNKTELVETISQRTDIAKKDVQAVLDTFEDIAGEIVDETMRLARASALRRCSRWSWLPRSPP